MRAPRTSRHAAAIGALALLVGCGARTSPLQREGGSPQVASRSSLLALGEDSSCAISGDGELRCWGSNSYGQLGDGTKRSRSLPTRIGADKRWSAIYTGGTFDQHSCAIETGGALWCWGSNRKGQLGHGGVASALLPRRVGTERWRDVAIGGSHTCAIRRDQTLWCWGDNNVGQLGIGEGYSVATRDTPAAVKTSADWVSVSSAYQHACGVQASGGLWCWGEGRGHELGSEINRLVDAPLRVGSATSWRVVRSGRLHSCALRSDGTLWCWGQNSHKQVSSGSLRKGGPYVVEVGSKPTRFKRFATGCGHNCAIRSDGALFCWGDNRAGQVGFAPTTRSVVAEPARVGQDSDWEEIAAGCRHSCGARAGGRLYCWGDNRAGQLGDGTRTARHAPQPVSR